MGQGLLTDTGKGVRHGLESDGWARDLGKTRQEWVWGAMVRKMLAPKRPTLPCHEQGQFHSPPPWAMVNLYKNILYGWHSSFWIPEAPGKPPLWQRTMTREELSALTPCQAWPLSSELILLIPKQFPAALPNPLQVLSHRNLTGI